MTLTLRSRLLNGSPLWLMPSERISRNTVRSFAVYRITKDIAAAMPMGNRQALKRGESAGRILLAGKNLAGTGYGYVKGNDLAKTIAYFYWYLPLQHWTNLTETVKGFGKEWAELTKIKPQPADEVVDAFYKEISKVSLDGGRVAADLRRIADIIQPIEMKVKTLSQQVATTKPHYCEAK
jgi:hypothetical protein